MPAFGELEFEAYCTCGKGICGNVDTRVSRLRKMPQIEVTPCEACIEKASRAAGREAAGEVREELQPIIEELRAEVRSLNHQIIHDNS